MIENLFQIVFSFGFLKWVWDGVWFVSRNMFRVRVTADIHVAYNQPGSDGVLEESCFVVVRNGTGKDVVVSGFTFEDHWWKRMRGRKFPEAFVPHTELMRVPAGKCMQMAFPWIQGNLVAPFRYSGVLTQDGKTVWFSSRRWKRVVREFVFDFPDWARHKRKGRQIQFKNYKSTSQPS